MSDEILSRVAAQSEMPLRDHFHPPISRRSSWEGFHGMWPAMIVRQLAPQLPEGFTAEPRVHLGPYYEIDDSTFADDPPPVLKPAVATGGTAATWAPPEPTLTVETQAYALSIGESLPTLPLWLNETLAVSLDLEASYEETCSSLRIA